MTDSFPLLSSFAQCRAEGDSLTTGLQGSAQTETVDNGSTLATDLRNCMSHIVQIKDS